MNSPKLKPIKDLYGNRLAPGEVELVQFFMVQVENYFNIRRQNLPVKLWTIEVTHHASTGDPYAKFRPQDIICYAGTVRKSGPFILIFGTDEGLHPGFYLCALGNNLKGKVKRWLKKDGWLQTILPKEAFYG